MYTNCYRIQVALANVGFLPSKSSISVLSWSSNFSPPSNTVNFICTLCTFGPSIHISHHLRFGIYSCMLSTCDLSLLAQTLPSPQPIGPISKNWTQSMWACVMSICIWEIAPCRLRMPHCYVWINLPPVWFLSMFFQPNLCFPTCGGANRKNGFLSVSSLTHVPTSNTMAIII